MPERRRRVVSRRVVGERVIGSASPVARWGRGAKTTCFDSISGFFVGLLLFCVTFALPYCAAKTEKISQQIGKLDVTAASEAAQASGQALVQGVLEAGSEITPPIVDVDKPLLAYEYKLERYETWTETHTETHTETRGGQDVEVTEEVEEEVSDWKVLDEDSQWAVVKLGGITIDPEKCSMDLAWQQAYLDEFSDALTGEPMRETVRVLYAGQSVLLAAELAGGQVISGSKPYRLTTESKEELVAQMHTEEETGRWTLLILSVILWTIAFNLMVGPAFILFNIFPLKAVGTAVRGIFFVIALITAIITTAVVYFVTKYWWVIVLLMIALAVAVVIAANRRREPEPELDLEAEELLPESDQS